jgi:hypothetical protein
MTVRVANETTYKDIEVTKLYAAYFFLGDTYIRHSRDVNDILDVLSNFGGLYALIINSFAAIGFLANNRLLFAKFIRNFLTSRNTVATSAKGNLVR